MVTTIQISEELKIELSKLKNNNSYEDVIKKLLYLNKKKLISEDMIEYGKKHSDDSLKELKEWEAIDEEW